MMPGIALNVSKVSGEFHFAVGNWLPPLEARLVCLVVGHN